MEIFSEFIAEYGTTILYTIITAVAGYIGIALKALYQKYINDKTKESVVKTCVKAVEQLYKNMGGEAKFERAVSAASEMLTEKGINITTLELEMLIESAVAEFNEAFKKPDIKIEKTE